MRRCPWLVLPLLLTAACSRRETPVNAAGGGQASVPVRVETLAPSDFAAVYQASGTVRARYSAAIAARIAASILEIRVHAGDRVQAGQTLVVLDRRDLEAQLARAEAARTEAESGMAEADHAIAAARANLELARITHKRFEDLLGKTSVSQQEFDESRARLKSAEAALEMAASKRKQIEARRSQADAEISAARVVLGYAAITAPFAGLVAERKADPGSLATPGAPLLILEREGNLRLEATLDESRLGLARAGETVQVEIEGLNRTVAGRLAEIAPAVDPATRSFTAKIDLPSVPGLRTGMFGRAGFPAAKRSAVSVPESAVLERGQLRSVYVVDAGITRLRLVTLGDARDGRREVLSGLSAGEKIVVSPTPQVADGVTVTAQETAR